MPSDTYTLTISDLGVAAVADNAVTTAKIADYNAGTAGTGVTTAKIVDLNVTTAKIANSAITTAKLVDSSSTTTGVTTDKIADGAVTTAKILNSAVTTAKLESYSSGSTGVTTAKIADLAVTTAKLADGAVTDAKITDGTISNAKLATISTALKVSNSATTATNANTASTIVARDGSGNFSAGVITAALTGNATTASSIAGGTAGQILYQSGPNTTQFIPAATAAGKLLVSGAGGTAAPTWGSEIGGVSSGGTGIYSYAVGDIIYADGANSLTKRAIGPSGSVLTSNGSIPVYLTTLPVGSGGTGVTDASTGSGGVVLSTSPTLVTPVLGVATGTSLDATGAITSSGAAGIGYAGTNAGGTVAQITSKSTSVLLNKICGRITMHNATLVHDTIVTFRLNNTTIAATDVLILNHVSVGTAGVYLLNAQCGAGFADIQVKNTHISSGAANVNNLGEAIVIAFVVIKAVTT
jgi:hypothetical protein